LYQHVQGQSDPASVSGLRRVAGLTDRVAVVHPLADFRCAGKPPTWRRLEPRQYCGFPRTFGGTSSLWSRTTLSLTWHSPSIGVLASCQLSFASCQAPFVVGLIATVFMAGSICPSWPFARWVNDKPREEGSYACIGLATRTAIPAIGQHCGPAGTLPNSDADLLFCMPGNLRDRGRRVQRGLVHIIARGDSGEQANAPLRSFAGHHGIAGIGD